MPLAPNSLETAQDIRLGLRMIQAAQKGERADRIKEVAEALTQTGVDAIQALVHDPKDQCHEFACDVFNYYETHP